MAMSSSRSCRFGRVCSMLLVLISAGDHGRAPGESRLAADEEESATELAKKTQTRWPTSSASRSRTTFFNSGSKNATVCPDVEPVILINITKTELTTRTIIPSSTSPAVPGAGKFRQRVRAGRHQPTLFRRRGGRRSSSGASTNLHDSDRHQ
jgi:hypothetical protein